MESFNEEKIIIVEGTTDKRKILKIIKEDVEVICTNGTISFDRLDEMVDDLFGRDVYILVDSDKAGDQLRKLFKREFPEAKHIYIDRAYREVATAPAQHLAAVLLTADIDVHTEFLK